MSATRGPGHIAPQCECGATGELRRCGRSRAIGWRCPRCLTCLSAWIGHQWLLAAGIDISRLPDWDAPARDERQRELAL